MTAHLITDQRHPCWYVHLNGGYIVRRQDSLPIVVEDPQPAANDPTFKEQ